jgi:hypothetical protein
MRVNTEDSVRVASLKEGEEINKGEWESQWNSFMAYLESTKKGLK